MGCDTGVPYIWCILSLRIPLGPSDDDVKKSRKYGEETRREHG